MVHTIFDAITDKSTGCHGTEQRAVLNPILFTLFCTSKATDSVPLQIHAPIDLFYIIAIFFCLFTTDSISVFEKYKYMYVFLKQTRVISPMILHFCVNIITSARVHMCSHHHHHHQYRYKENRYRVNWWIVSMWDCRRWQSIVLSLLRIPRSWFLGVRSIVVVCTIVYIEIFSSFLYEKKQSTMFSFWQNRIWLRNISKSTWIATVLLLANLAIFARDMNCK